MLALYLSVRHFDGILTSAGEIYINMMFLFSLLPGKHESLVAAGWSLGNEWLFYLTFPLFALLSRSVIVSCIAFVACILLSLSVTALATGLYGASYAYLSVLNHAMFFQAGVLAFSLIGKAQLGGMRKASGWFIAASISALIFNSQT